MSPSERVTPGRAAITAYLYALHAPDDAQQGLQGALAALPSLIGGCDCATVTIGTSVILSHVIAADPTNRRSEDMQRIFGEGPTLHALSTGYSVSCHDLRAEHRWPRWREHATGALGFGAVLVDPLRDRQRVIGALTLYSSTAGGLFDTDIRLLHALAFPLTRTLLEARLAPLADPSSPASLVPKTRQTTSKVSAAA